jgi:hypothetical protein
MSADDPFVLGGFDAVILMDVYEHIAVEQNAAPPPKPGAIRPPRQMPSPE